MPVAWREASAAVFGLVRFRASDRSARSRRAGAIAFGIAVTLALAVGVLARRFSHSLSSLRTEPSAHTILVQRSPSALKPCSQTSGQTRDGFCLIASSVSRLATLVSSLVPAWRLNSVSERCEAAFHSPSAAPCEAADAAQLDLH